MKLSDLMKPYTGEYGFEESEILKSHRVIALDGHDGKILFDTGKNKKEYIEKYITADVIGIWASAKEKFVDFGFSGAWFEPCTMMYLSHDSWLKEQK